MKTITLSEVDFENIFYQADREYMYDHEFAKDDEKLTDFKETLRHQHLMKFRNTLKSLKRRIENAWTFRYMWYDVFINSIEENYMSRSLDRIIAKHKHLYPNNEIRLGQYFCNEYVKDSWPNLFYEEDDKSSQALIQLWLNSNRYANVMPQTIKRGRKIEWSDLNKPRGMQETN